MNPSRPALAFAAPLGVLIAVALSATPEHFAPLKVWLDEQNKGQTAGWKAE